MPLDRSKYSTIKGNPRRRTRQSDATDQSDGASAKRRKRRVQVTPRDWEKLETTAATLGLPYAKVYNLAFRMLVEKIE